MHHYFILGSEAVECYNDGDKSAMHLRSIAYDLQTEGTIYGCLLNTEGMEPAKIIDAAQGYDNFWGIGEYEYHFINSILSEEGLQAAARFLEKHLPGWGYRIDVLEMNELHRKIGENEVSCLDIDNARSTFYPLLFSLLQEASTNKQGWDAMSST